MAHNLTDHYSRQSKPEDYSAQSRSMWMPVRIYFVNLWRYGWIVDVTIGGTVPIGYGLVGMDFNSLRWKFMPIPVNLVVRGLRWLGMRCLIGFGFTAVEKLVQGQVEEIRRKAWRESRGVALRTVRYNLRDDLESIRDWKLPTVDYEWQNGSNGARDYMRRRAGNALASLNEMIDNNIDGNDE